MILDDYRSVLEKQPIVIAFASVYYSKAAFLIMAKECSALKKDRLLPITKPHFVQDLMSAG